MYVDNSLVNKFFKQKNILFDIPIYQRQYKWKKKHCLKLLKDIIMVSKGTHNHSIGNLVYIEKKTNNKNRTLSIIDGQQRLTTLTLLFLAVYNQVKNNKYKKDDFVTPAKVMKHIFNVNKTIEESLPKLQLKEEDKEEFIKLLQDHNYKSTNQVVENYHTIYKEIDKPHIDINRLFDGLCQIELTYMEINEDDNPQLIFESLNSTGNKLSFIDLIKNFLLIDLTVDEQEYYYKNFWRQIEKKVNYKIKDFLFYYMTLKLEKQIVGTVIYDDFKSLFGDYKNKEEKRNKTKDLFNDLLKFATLYEEMFIMKSIEYPIQIEINNIISLEIKFTTPLILKIYSDYLENIITKEEVVEILKLFQSYYVRKAVSRLYHSNEKAKFPKYIKYIEKNDYVNSIKRLLLNQNEKERFVSDVEFKESLKNLNTNLLSKNQLKYILNKLNYNNSKNKIYSENLKVNFIMNSFNDEIEELSYKFKIGNLKLNKLKSYHDEIYNKFNTKLKNKEDILCRTEKITEDAIMVWKRPSYVSSEIELVLDDDWTGTNVKRFKMNDKNYKCNTFLDVYKVFITECILKKYKPSDILNIFQQMTTRRCWSYQSNDLKTPYQINDFFIELKLADAKDVATRIREIIDNTNELSVKDFRIVVDNS